MCVFLTVLKEVVSVSKTPHCEDTWKQEMRRKGVSWGMKDLKKVQQSVVSTPALAHIRAATGNGRQLGNYLCKPLAT